MASVTSHHYADARSVAGLKGLIAKLSARFEAWREYRRTVEELAALSTRDLNDLGISRADIRRIAYEAAFGPNA